MKVCIFFVTFLCYTLLCDGASVEGSAVDDYVLKMIAHLLKENAEIRRDMAAVQDDNMQTKVALSKVEEDNANLREVLNDRDSGHVFFSVMTQESKTYAGGDTIEFQRVESDVKPSGASGGWDASTNRFQCPVSGYYLVMYSIVAIDNGDGSSFYADLIVSDRMVVRLINRHQLGTVVAYTSTGNAVVRCAVGQQIYLRAGSGGRLHDFFQESLSQFSGFLIKPEV